MRKIGSETAEKWREERKEKKLVVGLLRARSTQLFWIARVGKGPQIGISALENS